MAWGEMTPEQTIAKLKEAGFDTAQINERLKTLDGVASKDEVKELRDAVAATKNTLDELANTWKNAPPKSEGANGGQGSNTVERQGPPQPTVIDPLAFMEDPTKHVRQLIQESMTPMALHSLSMAQDIAYDNAKATLPNFKIFEEEIKKEWDKYPVQQKGNPRQLIENLYYLVKGRHADEIATDTNKKEGKYNLVQSGGTTVIRRDEKKSNPVEDLTEQEIAIAKRMGVTPEDYAATKGGMKYV